MSQLELEINELKNELNQSVEKTGLNSSTTLYYSQKLDQLIFIYQRSKQDLLQNYERERSCCQIQ